LKAINIISFDVPYPANYGGVIDVFYKLKNFHKQGIAVHLHCFEYGRGEQKELEKYCSSITYYKRKTGATSFLSKLPYIVQSRADKQLKINLLKNDFPILFEGLHTCFLLADEDLKNRFKIVRNHNIEHHYYEHLAKAEKSSFRKHYFKNEAKKLKQFEPVLKHANLCLAISDNDFDYLKNTYQNTRIIHIPAFHQSNKVKIKQGLGAYTLYHGNLSVTENKNAVEYIVSKIYYDIRTPLIIAGLNPCKKIIDLINKYPHISLIKNPTNEELDELITNAQINLLYTEQATGLKLKLLNALYNGRHCIVNSKMIEGTSLNECCIVEDDVIELKKIIIKTIATPITDDAIEQRNIILNEYYSNSKNIKKILENFMC